MIQSWYCGVLPTVFLYFCQRLSMIWTNIHGLGLAYFWTPSGCVDSFIYTCQRLSMIWTNIYGLGLAYFWTPSGCVFVIEILSYTQGLLRVWLVCTQKTKRNKTQLNARGSAY
jgi:hypothetical protein